MRLRSWLAVVVADASNYCLPISLTGRIADPICCAADDVLALEGTLRRLKDGCFSFDVDKDDAEVRALPASRGHGVRGMTLPLPPRE